MSPRRGQALTCKHRMVCGCDLHNSISTLSMIRSVARCHADSMRTREPASARLRNGDTQLDDLMYLVGGEQSVPATPRSYGPVFRNDPERREFAYDVASTTLVTTQRCLPILRSRTNPSFS